MGVVRLFITVFIRKRNSGEAPNEAIETDAQKARLLSTAHRNVMCHDQ